ncbi:unnamed protein product, partial [Mesorhabditis spiculigera]
MFGVPLYATLLCLSAFAVMDARNHHHTGHAHGDAGKQNVSVLQYRPKVCTEVRHPGDKWHFCPKPRTEDGSDWPCIRASDLCNGLKDCPEGLDEDPQACFFHQLAVSQVQDIHHAAYNDLKTLKKQQAKPARNEFDEE